jgi:hypothetical protein
MDTIQWGALYRCPKVLRYYALTQSPLAVALTAQGEQMTWRLTGPEIRTGANVLVAKQVSVCGQCDTHLQSCNCTSFKMLSPWKFHDDIVDQTHLHRGNYLARLSQAIHGALAT